MQKTEYLFVYGTLRREVKNPIRWVLTRYGKLIGKATLKGKLYDLGSYPGVVLSDSPLEMVEGELYQLRDKDKVFEVLDPYEGYDPEEVHLTEFRREKIPIFLKDGEQVHGWVYLYRRTTEGLKRISSGDYLSFEGLMVRVPHHDPEQGRRVRTGLRVSLPSIVLGVVSQPNHSRTLSSSNRSYRSSKSKGRKL